MLDFLEQVQVYQKSVETTLDYWLPSVDSKPKKLHEAMRYSVLAEGKRIRPILLYATGQAFGVELDNESQGIERCRSWNWIDPVLRMMLQHQQQHKITNKQLTYKTILNLNKNHKMLNKNLLI